MSRLDGLAESQLSSRITALQLAITELKGSQYAGSANVLTERYVSGNAVDFTATVQYQVTTAWELTVNARDTTFAGNPYIWYVVWVDASTPVTTGYFTAIDTSVPGSGQAKMRLYYFGTDSGHSSFTIDKQIVIYGLNIGGFTVSRIL